MSEERNFKNLAHIQRSDLTLVTLMAFVSSRFIDSCMILDKITVFQELKEKLYLANLSKHIIQMT